VTKYHLYINDDKIHDNLFLQHCFGLHMQVLQSQNYPMPMDHIVFLDGSSSNFKCGRSLFYVSCFPSLIKCKKIPLAHACNGIILLVGMEKDGGLELEPLSSKH
jgi:hypothetical protein